MPTGRMPGGQARLGTAGLIWLLAATSAPAATIHVAPVGKIGAPGTLAAPLGSVQEALNRARPGDTVHLAAGVYRERVAFETGGTFGKPVTLEGEPGATLDGSEAVQPDWQPAPDVAPGVYRTALPFEPFTVTANGKIVTMLDERRVPPDAKDPNWQWPAIFRQGIAPTGFEGPKALGMYRRDQHDLLIRFLGDLAPRQMTMTLAPREPIVRVSGVDRCVVRGVTLQNCAEGVHVEASLGTVVEGCVIRHVDFGVVLGAGTDRCAVRFNEISMDPYAGADPALKGSWENWLAHKTGGFYDRTGIHIVETIGGHEVHDNLIHDQWDGIETLGEPGQNVGVNVHHNRISVVSDDGLEPNSSEENTQWHDNIVEHCICGFRIKAPQLGPMYAYRNIFFGNSEDYRNFGEDEMKPAVVYVYQNTCTAGTAITSNAARGIGTPNYHYFNNLFWCRSWWYGVAGSVQPNWTGDDNVYVRSAESNAWATGKALAAKLGLDLHSKWIEDRDAGFVDLAVGDVRLNGDSPARNAGADLSKQFGKPLPGCEPGYFRGMAPDAGALQFGEPMPVLPRPRAAAQAPTAGSWPGPEARSPLADLGPNLLANGGFETGLADWGPAHAIYRLRTDAAAEGKSYLAIVAGAQQDDLARTVSGLTKGKAYVLSYRSRRNTISDLRIIVRDLATTGYLAQGTGSRSPYWRRQVLYFTAPAEKVRLEISPRAEGVCDFDGFELRAKG